MSSLKSESRGLCVNCERAAHCTYRTRHTHGVIFCEDFQCEAFVSSSSSTEHSVETSVRNGQDQKNVCHTCDHEATCSLQTCESPQTRIDCELFE